MQTSQLHHGFSLNTKTSKEKKENKKVNPKKSKEKTLEMDSNHRDEAFINSIDEEKGKENKRGEGEEGDCDGLVRAASYIETKVSVISFSLVNFFGN